MGRGRCHVVAMRGGGVGGAGASTAIGRHDVAGIRPAAAPAGGALMGAMRPVLKQGRAMLTSGPRHSNGWWV
jgi:hypothetical protein